ncbi:MAG: nucleoside phosphorylase [Hyphomicrobiales bacterium]|nr:nucleoside phosphorylase [Hyphomicrobiales bacterium]
MTNPLPAYIHERMGGQLEPGSVAPYVLVPGSARRAEQFAARMQGARKLAEHYEFVVYTGDLDGVPVTACSTGCGGRSTSIAVDEMAALGGTTFLRVGVTGSLQPHVAAGDLIIASAAVRLDRTSEHYVRIEYPATAHFEVTRALITAARKLGYPYHVGIAATPATFSAGEGFATHGGYRQSSWDHIAPDLRAARVYDWDTETATIFTLASLYGFRAGRVNAVVDDPTTGKYNPVGETRAIETGLEALRILAAWDKEKEHTGRRYALPPYPLAGAAS